VPTSVPSLARTGVPGRRVRYDIGAPESVIAAVYPFAAPEKIGRR
jgi:hypothetical protein